MKNYYSDITSFSNLLLSFYQAAAGKHSRKYVISFFHNLETNILSLKSQLRDLSYRHGLYHQKTIKDSKKRIIKIAPFRDRVVHHALCNFIEPIFDKGFIYDSYACRLGKGTRKAVLRLGGFIQNRQVKYCLQMDISKYFQSIDHDILYKILRRKIKDKQALWLIREIIGSSIDNVAVANKQMLLFPNIGIPIGNLTSQLFANVYLNELDQYVKHKLRIRYYIRYMDDFLILGNNRKKLVLIKSKIRKFLFAKLRLHFHPQKANIYLVKKGINFLGYRIYAGYRVPKLRTVKLFIKKIRYKKTLFNRGIVSAKRYRQAISSWHNFAKFACGFTLAMRYRPKEHHLPTTMISMFCIVTLSAGKEIILAFIKAAISLTNWLFFPVMSMI